MTTRPLRIQSPPIFLPITILNGLGIGILTLLLQKFLPESLNQFANSGAVWSVLAFIMGWMAMSWRMAVFSGFLGLCSEVAGYYSIAYAAILLDISSATLAIISYWLMVALVAGPFFGWAGYVSTHHQGLLQKVGMASLGAIFMGEGLYLLSILPKPNTGLLWLGIALTLTLYNMWKQTQRLQFLLVTR